MKTSILIFLTSFLFLGCVAQEPKIDFKKPKMQVPKPAPVVKRNKGSLYTLKGPSLFADKKDLQIGDILQININESLSSNTSNSRETTSDRNASSTGLSATAGTTGGVAEKVANFINPITNLGYESKSSSSNKGDVTTSLSEDFSTTVSVIIEETYANGNYFVKGFKEILVDGQKQSITITGVIRPYDITSDNSVDSSQVAN
eukprot:Anaeramoba_flamelloidesa87036_20.p1 GENE.a87036_20~~a87036_20.p1  ORF type:complete len:202 (-),score=11.50 a87036_20:473-1078(-)